jgi:hypothetical protein
MNEESENGSSKEDVMKWAGIGPELAEFVTEFITKPIPLIDDHLEHSVEERIHGAPDQRIASLDHQTALGWTPLNK